MGRRSTTRPQAQPGEVVALSRLAEARTGDLLSPAGRLVADWPAPPPAVYALAIRAERQADEVKLAAALQRIAEEDPSVAASHNAETGEMILSGQGET